MWQADLSWISGGATTEQERLWAGFLDLKALHQFHERWRLGFPLLISRFFRMILFYANAFTQEQTSPRHGYGRECEL